jgi:hypothetical protein
MSVRYDDDGVIKQLEHPLCMINNTLRFRINNSIDKTHWTNLKYIKTIGISVDTCMTTVYTDAMIASDPIDIIEKLLVKHKEKLQKMEHFEIFFTNLNETEGIPDSIWDLLPIGTTLKTVIFHSDKLMSEDILKRLTDSGVEVTYKFKDDAVYYGVINS